MDDPVTHSANTPTCWEIRGEFAVRFRPSAELPPGLLETCGAEQAVDEFRFAAVRIRQTYGKMHHLQFSPMGNGSFFPVPHKDIVAIWNGEGGLEWLRSDI